MNLLWYQDAWYDYDNWGTVDKKKQRRINQLIKDTLRHPYEGIGKPEPLRENLSGWWSRRIDSANRLVYKQTGDTVIIAACKNHYE